MRIAKLSNMYDRRLIIKKGGLFWVFFKFSFSFLPIFIILNVTRDCSHELKIVRVGKFITLETTIFIMTGRKTSSNRDKTMRDAVATVLSLKKLHPDMMDDEILTATRQFKNNLEDSVIIVAINEVKKLLFKPEYLTEEIRAEMELWDNARD